MKRVAVLLSGGLDSTTATTLAHEEGSLALTISVNYGQRHARELNAAREVARYYGAEHVEIDLRGWGALLTGSALTDATIDVPSGVYESENMALTVVPNRNATLLMAAVAVAQARGATEVWTAVHAGDHELYADCRPEFIEAIALAAERGTGGKVAIKAPFVFESKTQIVRTAIRANAPLHLTWSCYRGAERHCGKCGTCQERRSSFVAAGVEDPTEYES